MTPPDDLPTPDDAPRPGVSAWVWAPAIIAILLALAWLFTGDG